MGGIFCDCSVIAFIINRNFLGLNPVAQCFVCCPLRRRHGAYFHTEGTVAPSTDKIKALVKGKVYKM